MGFSNAHNLSQPPITLPKPYGVRVSLRGNDPFASRPRTAWLHTAAERDAAMAEMSRKHEYSRPGDRPSLVYTKVENLASSRGL
jgi:hypothetical protein